MSFPMQLSLISYQVPIDPLCTEFDLDEIQDVQDKLLLKADALPDEYEREALHHHVRTFAKELRLKLEKLRASGASPQQIRQTGLDSLKELESSSSRMIQDFKIFQAGSRELEHQFAQFEAIASAPATPLTWTALSHVTVATRASLFTNVLDQYQFRSRTEPTATREIEKKIQKKFLKSGIEKGIGKVRTTALYKLDDFVSTQPPEDCDSPWRYKAISVGVKHGISVALSFVPTPVKAALNTSDWAATIANDLKPQLLKMESDEEARAWWKHQHDLLGDGDSYLESIQVVQEFAALASIPNLCLRSIQHELMDACATLSDRMGLTDEKIAQMAYSTLQYMVENNPETLEAKMWSQAIEDNPLRETNSP
jgi:hypothetical protein